MPPPACPVLMISNKGRDRYDTNQGFVDILEAFLYREKIGLFRTKISPFIRLSVPLRCVLGSIMICVRQPDASDAVGGLAPRMLDISRVWSRG